ncbi:hypothetical protein [Tenacibaculum ovolyticum]|uniref:hypothetical protein n=1 Tax=Tenacibaculum ovolyticum TaxID=104270 RepID=UPI003BA94DC9
MAIRKEITKDNELCLWMNGKLIYKRWLDDGYSKVFDKLAYDKYTEVSITDFDLEETPEIVEVKAKLKLYSKIKGGRDSAIITKYRPNHVFEYNDKGDYLMTFIGQIEFNNVSEILPGEEKEVLVKFLFHMPIEKYLNIERKWWIHEGNKCIGEGEILEIRS